MVARRRQRVVLVRQVIEGLDPTTGTSATTRSPGRTLETGNEHALPQRPGPFFKRGPLFIQLITSNRLEVRSRVSGPQGAARSTSAVLRRGITFG